MVVNGGGCVDVVDVVDVWMHGFYGQCGIIWNTYGVEYRWLG
jgi:hypothetical protein